MDVDDAVQEVFIECYRQGGVLAEVDQDRPGGFRAFLFGVARNVARRVEKRRAQHKERQPDTGFDFSEARVETDELAKEFDRAWARGIMRQAAELQAEHSQAKGEEAVKRVELLRLRFQEGLAIREIAARWKTDAARLHYEYQKARNEFEDALREVVAFHNPNVPQEARKECEALIALLDQG